MEKFFTRHPKIQKFLAFLVIVAIFIPTFFATEPPKKAEAWGVLNFSIAEFGAAVKNLAGQAFKQVAMGIARKMLNAMTARTVNWINSGFHGNPFYLTNTDTFFKDIVKYEVKSLVDVYAYNKVKYPFGKQFALDTIASYQRQLEDNTAYTLSKAINDPVYLESYRTDFNVGGWDGFFVNTQYPQNNYIGFRMKAGEDLARKLDGTVQNKAQQVQDTLQKSQGFLAPKLCMDKDTKYNNAKNEFLQPTFKSTIPFNPPPLGGAGDAEYKAYMDEYNSKVEAEKAKWGETNTCKNLTTTTPGTVIANQILTATSSKFRQSELGQAVGNSLSAVFDALVSKLVDKSVGLLGMGSTNPPESSTANDFDYKGGIQAAAPSQDTQLCLDLQLAAGDTTSGQSGSSCINISGGGVPAGVDPLSFFNFPGSATPTGGATGPVGGACVGGNMKCSCAEGVAAYDVYANAVSDAESVAYPNGLPSGTTGRQAQTAVCAAYKGPGACKAGVQEDEVIITGLSAPYVTLSIDFLTGGAPYPSNALYSRSVAACEAGVQ